MSTSGDFEPTATGWYAPRRRPDGQWVNVPPVVRNVAGPGITIDIRRYTHRRANPLIRLGEVDQADVSIGANDRLTPWRVILEITLQGDTDRRLYREWAHTADVREACLMLDAAIATGANPIPISIACSCGCARTFDVHIRPEHLTELIAGLRLTADMADRQEHP